MSPQRDRALLAAGVLWLVGCGGGACVAWITHSTAPSLFHWAARVAVAFGPGVWMIARGLGVGRGRAAPGG